MSTSRDLGPKARKIRDTADFDGCARGPLRLSDTSSTSSSAPLGLGRWLSRPVGDLLFCVVGGEGWTSRDDKRPRTSR